MVQVTPWTVCDAFVEGYGLVDLRFVTVMFSVKRFIRFFLHNNSVYLPTDEHQ